MLPGYLRFIVLLFFLPASGIARQQPADSLARRHFLAAQLLFSQSKTGEALKELVTARDLFTKTTDTAGRFGTTKTFADYYFQNYLDSAATVTYLSLVQKPVNDSLSTEIHSKLAALYVRNRSYTRALQEDSVLLGRYAERGARKEIAGTWLQIAGIRNAQQRQKEAETILLRKCLPLFSSAGNPAGRLETFLALGATYLALEQNSEAKWFYIQAKMLADKLHSRPEMVRSLTGLGAVKTAIKDYDLALADLKEGERLALANGRDQELAPLYEAFYKLYTGTGNAVLAKQSLSRFQQYKNAEHYRISRKAALARQLIADAERPPVAAPLKFIKKLWPVHAKVYAHFLLLFVILFSLTIGLVLFIRHQRIKK